MDNTRRRITLPSLGSVSVNFYCSSSWVYSLYEKVNEFDRLRKVSHLGIISTVIDGASHSRYEYAMLQCALADVLDKLHKGSVSQGEIKIDSTALKGNGILKSWFLLSNFGHLKNTFADEKALILFALKRRGFVSRLLSPIRSKLLKDWCENVIRTFQYSNFHYVISIYRIYKCLPRQIEKQNDLAKLLELLLVEVDSLPYKISKQKIIQLRGLFSKIRDIAIVTIDGHYSHTPLDIDLISSVVSFDEIEGGVFGKDIASSLSPLRSLLHEEIYLHQSVVAAQRSYEVSALSHITTLPQNNDTYDEIIRDAIEKGLLPSHQNNLFPFCRIPISPQIQPDTTFYDEFRNLTVKSRRGCQNTESYLDENPFTNVRYADFLVSSEFESSNLPRLLYNISNLIGDQLRHLIHNTGKNYWELLRNVERSAIRFGLDQDIIRKVVHESNATIRKEVRESADNHLFPLYRNLLWSVISFFIKGNYRIDIDHSGKTYDNYAFSHPELGDGMLLSALDDAIAQEADVDEDRAHELLMLKQFAKRKHEGFKIACLARIKILDMANPPERMLATDIDAVLLKISGDHVTLELMEAKNQKRGREKSAVTDINKNIIPVLNKRGQYRVRKVSGYGAKLVLKCSR